MTVDIFDWFKAIRFYSVYTLVTFIMIKGLKVPIYSKFVINLVKMVWRVGACLVTVCIIVCTKLLLN